MSAGPVTVYLVAWMSHEVMPGAVIVDAGIYTTPTPPTETGRKPMVLGVERGETRRDAEQKMLASVRKQYPKLAGAGTLSIQARGIEPQTDGSSATLAERRRAKGSA